jgi:catechol 2,3-dioxygenase-like lactoylglutathione lyase family enzyme
VAGVNPVVTITASDLTPALAWYDAALGAIGWTRVDELVDEEEDDAPVEAVGWAPPGEPARVWVVAGPPERATTGLHLRLPANSRAQVETFHAAAVAAGGRAVAAPRRWTPYRTGEFAATVADPAGNRLEAVGPE